jgi:hypothetical protein
MPHPVSLGQTLLRLSGSVSRVFQLATDRPELHRHLQQMRVAWEEKATLKDRALVYAAALWTFDRGCEEILPETATHASPLRNGAALVATQMQRRLAESEEGRLWLEHLARPSAKDDDQAIRSWIEVNRALVEESRILVRLMPNVPLFVVNWERTQTWQLPAQRS